MSNKKNIDRLFQEKFRDFEANPANDFWNNIEAKLDEKKRKRVIPFWWKFSGVAAVFLIGILIGNQVLNDDIAPSNPIVVEDNSNQNKGKATDGILEKDGVNGISPKLKTNTAEAVSENSGTTKNITPKSDNTSDDVIVDKTSNEQKSSGKLILSPMVNDSKATIAHGKSNKNSSSKNKLNLGKNKTSVNETLNKEEVQLVVNKEKNNQSINNIRAKSELNETNPLVQTTKMITTNPILPILY